jgi:chromosome segregation ATPase
MATPKWLTRLEILEVKVSALEALPARIDALAMQIGEQREALDRAVSALRGEIASCKDELRREIAGVKDDLRQEIAGLRDELRQEIAGARDELRQVMHTLIGETRTHMLVLHEEVLERIKLVGEGRPARKGPPRRRH